jgi:hypothetical protein
VKVPAGFFTPAQNKQLQARLKKNDEAAKQREAAAAAKEKDARIEKRVKSKILDYSAVGGMLVL